MAARWRILGAMFWVAVVVEPAFCEGPADPLTVARQVIDAVNSRDADSYVRSFSPDVEVRLFDGEVRIAGREALRENRRRHFERHPSIRAEIVALVRIDDRTVRWDRVRLAAEGAAVDIVEIYTFRDGLVVRVDVLQPSGLVPSAATQPSAAPPH
jgi:hypothetical protein